MGFYTKKGNWYLSNAALIWITKPHSLEKHKSKRWWKVRNEQCMKTKV